MERIDDLCRVYKGEASLEDISPLERDDDDTLFHRSAVKEYYRIYLENIAKLPLPGESNLDTVHALSAFLANYINEIETGKYDYIDMDYAAEVCERKGWPHLFGWRAESPVSRPLTQVFQCAVESAFDIYQFHNLAMGQKLSLSPYEVAIVLYRDLALRTAGLPTYEPIIQTQSQISNLGVALRSDFEQKYGRPMNAEDWDRLEQLFGRLLLRDAIGSRIQHFRHSAAFCMGQQVFEINQTGNSAYTLAWRETDDVTVQNYIEGNSLQNYVQAISGKLVTGCPALFARGAQGDFLSLLSRKFIRAVRTDFWPQEKKAVQYQADACPFAARHKPANLAP